MLLVSKHKLSMEKQSRWFHMNMDILSNLLISGIDVLPLLEKNKTSRKKSDICIHKFNCVFCSVEATVK